MIWLGGFTWLWSIHYQLRKKTNPGIKKEISWISRWSRIFGLVAIFFTFLAFFNVGIFTSSDKLLILLRGMGLAILIFGIFLEAWAMKTLDRYYSPGAELLSDGKVVQEGPFALVRHPIYVGDIFLQLGIALALMSYLAVTFVVIIYLPVLLHKAQLEEDLISREHPEDYREYKNKVGMFFPF